MTSFMPKDPDDQRRVKETFNRQRVMQTLGVTLKEPEPGEIQFTMPANELYTQQHGFMHAGIITTALDSACGCAAFSLMPADAAIPTVEFKTNLVAPAKGESFVFHARVIKPGRTLTLCDAQAFAIDGGTKKLIATMSGTLMALYGRQDIQRTTKASLPSANSDA